MGLSACTPRLPGPVSSVQTWPPHCTVPREQGHAGSSHSCGGSGHDLISLLHAGLLGVEFTDRRPEGWDIGTAVTRPRPSVLPSIPRISAPTWLQLLTAVRERQGAQECFQLAALGSFPAAPSEQASQGIRRKHHDLQLLLCAGLCIGTVPSVMLGLRPTSLL